MFWSFFVSCSHLQLGMRKTTITFNAVITACEKAARWQARACLFAELTQPCLSHHPECSDNFISCWTTSHNTRVFTSIAQECFKSIYTFNVWTKVSAQSFIDMSRAVFACLCEVALKLFSFAQPDVVSCSAAISACEKETRWRQAR